MVHIFYSLREAAERLKKTEEELRTILKEGRLREFRDGPMLLLKVDEVEALAAQEGIPRAAEALTAERPAAEDLLLKTPELEGAEAVTAQEQALDLHASDLPILELETQDLETAALKDLVAKSAEPKIASLQAQAAERPTTEDFVTEEFATAQAQIISTARLKAKTRMERAIYSHRLSAWKWLFKGLREDNLGPIIVFCLLLFTILSACAALGYLLLSAL